MFARYWSATQLCVAGAILFLSLHQDMALSESATCSQNWIYHASTKSCLKIGERINYCCEYRNPCSAYKGGEFHNETGNIVRVHNDYMDSYLKEMLQDYDIAYVVVAQRIDRARIPNSDKYHIDCIQRSPDGSKYIPVRVKRGKLLQDEINCTYSPVLCQVAASISENSSSSYEVTVASSSDSNITMTWKPRQIGHLVFLSVKVYKCSDEALGEFVCTNLTKQSRPHISAFKETNFTIDNLQPERRYKISVEIFNAETRAIVFNESYHVKTMKETGKEVKEESNAMVIAGSLVLAACICVITVLAVLLYAVFQRYKGLSTSMKEKTAVDSSKGTTSFTSLQTTSSKDDARTKPGHMAVRYQTNVPSNVGNYGNVKINLYNSTNEKTEEHIYEI